MTSCALVLVVALVASGASAAPAGCPRGCQCPDPAAPALTPANCSSLAAARALGPHLHALRLTHAPGDASERLDAGAFWELPSLHALHLPRLGLRALRPGAFRGLARLHALDVSHNALGDADALARALADLPALRDLSLRANHLDAVPPLVEATPALETLDLGRCRLRELPPAALRALTHLRHLRLDGNLLRTLPADVLPTGLVTLDLSDNHIRRLPSRDDLRKKLPHLAALELAGNPLHCTCDLLKMTADYAMREPVVCAAPKRLAGQELLRLKKHDVCGVHKKVKREAGNELDDEALSEEELDNGSEEAALDSGAAAELAPEIDSAKEITGTDTDVAADSDTDTDAVSDVAADADTDTDAVSDVAADADTDTDAVSDVAADTDTDAVSDVAADTDTDTDTVSEVAADTDVVANTNTDVAGDTDDHHSHGAHIESDAGASDGTDSHTVPRTNTGADEGTGLDGDDTNIANDPDGDENDSGTDADSKTGDGSDLAAAGDAGVGPGADTNAGTDTDTDADNNPNVKKEAQSPKEHYPSTSADDTDDGPEDIDGDAGAPPPKGDENTASEADDAQEAENVHEGEQHHSNPELPPVEETDLLPDSVERKEDASSTVDDAKNATGDDDAPTDEVDEDDGAGDKLSVAEDPGEEGGRVEATVEADDRASGEEEPPDSLPASTYNRVVAENQNALSESDADKEHAAEDENSESPDEPAKEGVPEGEPVDASSGVGADINTEEEVKSVDGTEDVDAAVDEDVETAGTDNQMGAVAGEGARMESGPSLTDDKEDADDALNSIEDEDGADAAGVVAGAVDTSDGNADVESVQDNSNVVHSSGVGARAEVENETEPENVDEEADEETEDVAGNTGILSVGVGESTDYTDGDYDTTDAEKVKEDKNEDGDILDTVDDNLENNPEDVEVDEKDVIPGSAVAAAAAAAAAANEDAVEEKEENEEQEGTEGKVHVAEATVVGNAPVANDADEILKEEMEEDRSHATLGHEDIDVESAGAALDETEHAPKEHAEDGSDDETPIVSPPDDALDGEDDDLDADVAEEGRSAVPVEKPSPEENDPLSKEYEDVVERKDEDDVPGGSLAFVPGDDIEKEDYDGVEGSGLVPDETHPIVPTADNLDVLKESGSVPTEKPPLEEDEDGSGLAAETIKDEDEEDEEGSGKGMFIPVPEGDVTGEKKVEDSPTDGDGHSAEVEVEEGKDVIDEDEKPIVVPDMAAEVEVAAAATTTTTATTTTAIPMTTTTTPTPTTEILPVVEDRVPRLHVPNVFASPPEKTPSIPPTVLNEDEDEGEERETLDEVEDVVEGEERTKGNMEAAPEGSSEAEGMSINTIASYAVLGAIMLIVAVLLGYAVCRSRRRNKSPSAREKDVEGGRELQDVSKPLINNHHALPAPEKEPLDETRQPLMTKEEEAEKSAVKAALDKAPDAVDNGPKQNGVVPEQVNGKAPAATANGKAASPATERAPSPAAPAPAPSPTPEANGSAVPLVNGGSPSPTAPVAASTPAVPAAPTAAPVSPGAVRVVAKELPDSVAKRPVIIMNRGADPAQQV